MRAYFENRDKISDNRDFLSDFPLEAAEKLDIDFRAHWHNEIEIVLVQRGFLTMGINSSVQVLKAGDVAYVSSGDVHYYEQTDTTSEIILIIFSPSLLSSSVNFLHYTFPDPFITEPAEHHLIPTTAGLGRIRDCINQIYYEANNKQAEYQVIVKGLVLQLFGEMLREMPYIVGSPHQAGSGLKSKDLVQDAIRYIESHLNDELSVALIAGFLGVSEFYLSRIFNQLTGQPFKTYINNLRLDNAQKLLVSSDKTITEIAYECGFNSLRTFNRVFKNTKGTIPSNFR